jgi:hypothetical protein
MRDKIGVAFAMIGAVYLSFGIAMLAHLAMRELIKPTADAADFERCVMECQENARAE